MKDVLVELNDGIHVVIKKVIKEGVYMNWKVVVEYQNAIEYHKITDIRYIGG